MCRREGSEGVGFYGDDLCMVTSRDLRLFLTVFMIQVTKSQVIMAYNCLHVLKSNCSGLTYQSKVAVDFCEHGANRSEVTTYLSKLMFTF